MSAVVEKTGEIRPLDLRAAPNEHVSLDQVTDPERLARLLQKSRQDIADLRRPWRPDAIDHRDLVVDATGTTLYRLPHAFGGRVNWWPVDWSGAVAGPQLVRDASSDDNTLVLTSYTAGTVTVRIEQAG